MLTYDTQAGKDADKQQLDRCREALGITENALCLDDCELWQLRGTRGRITTYGDGESYLLHLYPRSRRAFNSARKRLAFMTVTQGGDGEGVLRFRLPVDAAGAEETRDLAGLRKSISDDAREALRERARLSGFGSNT